MKRRFLFILFTCITLSAFTQTSIPVDVYVVNPNGCPYSVTTTWSNQYIGAGNGVLIGIDTLANQDVYHFLVPDTLSATYFTVCAVPAPPCTCPNSCAGPMPIYSNIAITLLLCPTGITDFSNTSAVDIFPNPASELINITSTEVMSNVSFYDLTGRCVKSLSVASTSVMIETEGMTAGLYFIHVKNSDGEIACKKLIIR